MGVLGFSMGYNPTNGFGQAEAMPGSGRCPAFAGPLSLRSGIRSKKSAPKLRGTFYFVKVVYFKRVRCRRFSGEETAV